MKILKFNESQNWEKSLSSLFDEAAQEFESKKDYIQDFIVIDPQYAWDMPKDVKDAINEKGRSQNSYVKFYPGDGFYKPLSEHKDPSKAIFYDERSKNEKNPYAYEMGSDLISDWLFNEGFGPKDNILFLVWW